MYLSQRERSYWKCNSRTTPRDICSTTNRVLHVRTWEPIRGVSLAPTCQRTVYHVVCSSRAPCALMVENRVCPALFLTAGLGSTHSSPNLEYRHIHIRSDPGTGRSYLAKSYPLSPTFSSSLRMLSRFWDKKSDIFHWRENECNVEWITRTIRLGTFCRCNEMGVFSVADRGSSETRSECTVVCLSVCLSVWQRKRSTVAVHNDQRF